MGARRSSDGQTQELNPEDDFDGTVVVANGDVRLESDAAAVLATDADAISASLKGPSAYVADRLIALYQATLEQPVPDRFLELLEKLDRGEGQA